jgi:serine/threonine-protein kinase HipA
VTELNTLFRLLAALDLELNIQPRQKPVIESTGDTWQMARPRIIAALHLFMNGQRVGCLTRIAVGQLRFEYGDEWLHSELRRSLSLSMPLSQKVYIGDIVENFFDNLLPNSQPIRSRIQARFGAKSNRCFDLLWHVGRDCVEAMQLLPKDTAAIDVRRINAEKLTDTQIAEVLRNYATMPFGMKGDDDFRTQLPWYSSCGLV